MSASVTVGLVVVLVFLVATRVRVLTVAGRPVPPRQPVEARRTWRTAPRHLGPALLLAGGGLTLGVAPTIGVLTLWLLYRRTSPRRVRRRQRRAVERDLPDVMDLLSMTIRTGLTPRQAIEAIADAPANSCTAAFAEVVRRTQRGQPFADALAALPAELGPGADGIADAIASCDRYGLPLGPLLEQIAAEARATRRRLDQADARRLPVKLSFPLVACTLPSFVLLAIAPAVIAALSSLQTW